MDTRRLWLARPAPRGGGGKPLPLPSSDLGQAERAIEHYEQALAIAREIGDRRREGVWLDKLGDAYRDLGQVEQTIQYYEQALAIFEQIKSPDADKVREGLARLRPH